MTHVLVFQYCLTLTFGLALFLRLRLTLTLGLLLLRGLLCRWRPFADVAPAAVYQSGVDARPSVARRLSARWRPCAEVAPAAAYQFDADARPAVARRPVCSLAALRWRCSCCCVSSLTLTLDLLLLGGLSDRCRPCAGVAPAAVYRPDVDARPAVARQPACRWRPCADAAPAAAYRPDADARPVCCSAACLIAVGLALTLLLLLCLDLALALGLLLLGSLPVAGGLALALLLLLRHRSDADARPAVARQPADRCRPCAGAAPAAVAPQPSDACADLLLCIALTFVALSRPGRPSRVRFLRGFDRAIQRSQLAGCGRGCAGLSPVRRDPAARASTAPR